ncbi:putative knottin, scorpion toxin [Medicago truncatula]|uniref:Putative knottin, scorpion toxin n=1 Tax=Medicago truncatula TaxID=3880 RepID=A0A396GBP8_MEDTR|nr:putative knottin, scorpion toxin [Medicago truncatula]
MISSTSKFYTVFMFICLVVLLISASEEEEKICEINYHHTQSEYGCDKSSCNEVCINIEHATYEAKEKNCRVKHHTNVEHTNGCDKSNCNEVCINKDHATYGYCVPSIPYFSFCFCYFC